MLECYEDAQSMLATFRPSRHGEIDWRVANVFATCRACCARGIWRTTESCLTGRTRRSRLSIKSRWSGRARNTSTTASAWWSTETALTRRSSSTLLTEISSSTSRSRKTPRTCTSSSSSFYLFSSSRKIMQ